MAAHLSPPAAPPHSRRDRVLDLLREAGPAGITHRELQERGRVGMALVHVESLKCEGHVIETLRGVDNGGLGITRITLVRDIWLEPYESVRFARESEVTTVPIERGEGRV